jgi:dCMP deaminase
MEQLEQSADPYRQQVDKCRALARVIIRNDGTLDELYRKVDRMLLDLKKKYYQRPSWDEYFLTICREVARRATCDRGRAGCVIVKDKRILCTGYVGSPAGLPHCDDIGHLMKTVVHENKKTQHCVRTIHAEQNAICQAAREGISLRGSTLYCRMEPCSVCAKMIINCEIQRVVCEKRYHAAEETRALFAKSNVTLVVISKETEPYPHQ